MKLGGRRLWQDARKRAVVCAAALIAAGCAAEQDDPQSRHAMIGAAAQGAAGEGVEGDEGEDEEGTAGDGDPAQDMGGGEPADQPSFGAVYGLLSAHCGGGQNGCHITGMAADLALPDAQAAHAALVGVASRRCDGELLVAPGEPDQSLLVTVLQGGADCVKAMPLGRDPLGDDDVATIRAWIHAGAHAD